MICVWIWLLVIGELGSIFGTVHIIAMGSLAIGRPTDSANLYITAAPPTLCEARTEGLVRYPTTLAPTTGSVTVTAQCADNAIISRGSNLCVHPVMTGLDQLLSVNVILGIMQ